MPVGRLLFPLGRRLFSGVFFSAVYNYYDSGTRGFLINKDLGTAVVSFTAVVGTRQGVQEQAAEQSLYYFSGNTIFRIKEFCRVKQQQ